jgi:hypothetical protein
MVHRPFKKAVAGQAKGTQAIRFTGGVISHQLVAFSLSVHIFTQNHLVFEYFLSGIAGAA